METFWVLFQQLLEKKTKNKAEICHEIKVTKKQGSESVSFPTRSTANVNIMWHKLILKPYIDPVMSE